MGFAYWLAFLLTLGPWGVLHRLQTAWDQEVLRLLGASLLGAAAAPCVLSLGRRFPIEGQMRWRHAVVHAGAAVVLAFVLIVASCVLADWFLVRETRPLATAIRANLIANWLLLTYAVAAFDGLAHAVRFHRRVQQARQPASASGAFLREAPVPRRGGVLLLDLAKVDRIESQGNYLALHADGAVHLIRETLARFEGRLEPRRFVRVHRGMLVAVDRIAELVGRASGDVDLRLRNGVVVTVSRRFKARVRAALGEA